MYVSIKDVVTSLSYAESLNARLKADKREASIV